MAVYARVSRRCWDGARAKEPAASCLPRRLQTRRSRRRSARDAGGGVVSVWGMVTSFWDDGDVVGRPPGGRRSRQGPDSDEDRGVPPSRSATTRCGAGSISSTTTASAGSPPTSADRRGLQAHRVLGGAYPSASRRGIQPDSHPRGDRGVHRHGPPGTLERAVC